MVASVADRASQRLKTVASQRDFLVRAATSMRGRPSTHSKEISRTNVHSNHHRTHNQPEPTPSIHNPTSQQPRHANFPQRRQQAPRNDGRRETLLHVARRQKDPRPRSANYSRPSVPCRSRTSLGRMTPTGPGPKSSRAVGWRRSWTCRSFRPPRMSCPWLSLRATSSKGYASGPREDVCRRIGRGCSGQLSRSRSLASPKE